MFWTRERERESRGLLGSRERERGGGALGYLERERERGYRSRKV